MVHENLRQKFLHWCECEKCYIIRSYTEYAGRQKNYVEEDNNMSHEGDENLNVTVVKDHSFAHVGRKNI